MKKLITYVCGAMLFATSAHAMEHDAAENRIVPAEAEIGNVAAVVRENSGQRQQRQIDNPFVLRLGPVVICPRDGADATVYGMMCLANLANRNGWFTRTWERVKHLGRSIKHAIEQHPVLSGVIVATVTGAAVTTLGYAHA